MAEKSPRSTSAISDRRHGTEYIQLNTANCQACWECVEACPNDVLGKLDVFFHRHVRVVAAENCAGCGACVQACRHEAITLTVA
jgi:2-oxoglutarate ferredoxin oxidoreductase subunit delta